MIAIALTSTGCMSSGSESGIRIGDATLEQFEAGTTRETWVRAILGEPTSEGRVADEPDVHVLRYATQQSEQVGMLASLFGKSDEWRVSTIYFVIQDGVVERFWADRSESPGLFSGKADGGEKRDD